MRYFLNVGRQLEKHKWTQIQTGCTSHWKAAAFQDKKVLGMLGLSGVSAFLLCQQTSMTPHETAQSIAHHSGSFQLPGH